MKDLSAAQTLLATLPIVFVLLVLIAAIMLFSQGGLLETRSKAATTRIVPAVTLAPTMSPEYACAELYDPVCGANGITYTTRCEAGVANITIAYQGECTSTFLPQTTE